MILIRRDVSMDVSHAPEKDKWLFSVKFFKITVRYTKCNKETNVGSNFIIFWYDKSEFLDLRRVPFFYLFNYLFFCKIAVFIFAF